MDRILSALNNLGIGKQLNTLIEDDCKKAFKLKLMELNVRLRQSLNEKEYNDISEKIKRLNDDYNIILKALSNKTNFNKGVKQQTFRSNPYSYASQNYSYQPQKYWNTNHQFKSFDFLDFWFKMAKFCFNASSFVSKKIAQGINYLFLKYPKEFKICIIIFCTSIILTFILFSFRSNKAANNYTLVKQEYGYIVVKSYPWAELYINNKFSGNVPSLDRIKVRAGENIVKLVFKKYEPLEIKIYINRDEIVYFNINKEDNLMKIERN